jgi:hypothetical protein
MTLPRRAFLQLSVLAVGALVASSADARKVRPTVELFYGAELAQPEPGAIRVLRFGTHPSHARLVARVLPTKIEITSKENDNSRFTVRFELPRRTDPLSHDNRNPLARYFLHTGSTWWWPSGAGRSTTAEMAMFDLDRASAIQVGRQLGVPLQERRPLDKDILFTWSAPASATTTSPITIGLQLDNQGTDEIVAPLAARNFHLEVVRDDGTRMARRDRRNFAAPYTTKLRPGSVLSVVTDVHDHVVLDRPGTYEVTATYMGVLVDPAASALYWELRRTYKTTIVVH